MTYLEYYAGKIKFSLENLISVMILNKTASTYKMSNTFEH